MHIQVTVKSRRNIFYIMLSSRSVEAGVHHDVAQAPPPPPPATETLAVELESLEPGPRHAGVLRLEQESLLWGKTFYGYYDNGKFFIVYYHKKPLQFDRVIVDINLAKSSKNPCYAKQTRNFLYNISYFCPPSCGALSSGSIWI